MLGLTLEKALDLEVRVQILEVSRYQADRDAGAESMPGRVVVVHLVAQMARQSLPILRAFC